MESRAGKCSPRGVERILRRELEGFPRDWLPHMRQQNAQPLVWLRSRSRLSDVTLRSGPGTGTGVLVARCPGVAEEVVIERCVIRATDEAQGWLPEVPIRVAGDTYGFVVRDCLLEGRGGVEVISTSNQYAYIGHNDMRSIPNGKGNMKSTTHQRACAFTRPEQHGQTLRSNARPRAG